MPLGPAAPMPAAVSIHCCERTAMALRASASGGSRRAERSSERTASLCGTEQFEPAHQHVEQPLARRFLFHVGIDLGQHLAVELLGMGGEDGERRAEFAAQFGERDAGALGQLGEADPLDRLLGQQRHKRVDDAFARRAGRGGRATLERRGFERAALRAMTCLLRSIAVTGV